MTPEPSIPLAIRLAVSALLGLAVGVERERSGHAQRGSEARFAGVRTFMLLGGLGGVIGWLLGLGLEWSAAALIVAGGALVTGAYVSTVRTAGVDGTTEVAALVVLALGTLAGWGELAVASGAAAVVVVALSEKETIHRLLHKIDETELRAALYFAVLALVVLPVLPNRGYGPWGGVNPRSLWIVVLIFSGLNFAGYVAHRIAGASRGYGVAGALGGLVSSTAVTLTFARRSALAPDFAAPLGVGVVAASTVLLLRVMVLSAILNRLVALALVPLLLPPLVAGLAVVGYWLSRSSAPPNDATPGGDGKSPLGVRSAITMALAFQVTLTAMEVIRSNFGSPGILASAALLGLTDMDALTLAMNRLGQDRSQTALAGLAIGVGVLANALLKLALAVALGGPGFRRVAVTGLLVLAGASALAIWAVAR